MSSVQLTVPGRPTLAPHALLALLAFGLLLRAVVFIHGVGLHPELLQPHGAEIEAELADPSAPFVSALGFEASNVAWALVCSGEGFASPFGGGTGPTGWVSPGIVAPWALAFALFGCFSPGAVLSLFAVAAVASLAMIALGALTAARLFRSARAGVVAGALLALSPWDLAVFHAESLLDPDLTALAALALVALLVRIADRPRRLLGSLTGFSAVAGVAVLINPVLALPAICGLAAAVLGGTLLVRRPFTAEKAWTAGTALGLFIAGQLLLVGPWIVHQHAALGGWSLVKSNLPFEIDLGNRPGVGGVYRPELFAALHPSANREEYGRYRQLGEREYVSERFAQFLERLDPLDFARATGRRAAHALFLSAPRPWQGRWSRRVHALLAPVPGVVLWLYPLVPLLGWRRLWPADGSSRPVARGLVRGDAVVYTVVATYLLPYLAAGVTERYLLPLVSLVLVLAAGPVAWLFSRGGSSDSRASTVISGRRDGPKRTPVRSGRFS